jgi:hypothetical protein
MVKVLEQARLHGLWRKPYGNAKRINPANFGAMLDKAQAAMVRSVAPKK